MTTPKDTMHHLKLIKPATEAEKTTRTTLDVFEVTPAVVSAWKLPPFQRPLRVNAKVLTISKEIAETGVIPGVMTLGILDATRYLVDGQHRREAFLLSGVKSGYVDVRVGHYSNLAEMAEEFGRLNSRISNMRPDDFLRAMESTSEQVQLVRKACPFVGFDSIRRSERAPILSMSTTLRAWWMSAKDVPGGGSVSAVRAAEELLMDDARNLVEFLGCAMNAWGRDAEYVRVWGALNLTLCMWLYRRMVITQYSAKTPKIDRAQYQKCLQSLSADPTYIDWLHARLMNERNRSPCYNRIKAIFAKRLEADLNIKAKMPTPAWVAS